MTDFTGIPAVPTTTDAMVTYQFLAAIKQNIEVLTGSSTGAAASRAVLHGDITLTELPPPSIDRVSFEGEGIQVQNHTVPTLTDTVRLATDVNTLIAEVTYLRQVVNALIVQLRG